MVSVIIISICLALIFFLLGGREIAGELLTKLFPSDYMRVGDKIDVFMDGAYNRTATITGIDQDHIIIYGTLQLPIEFRGRFYATGVDQTDGTRLVYVKTRKYFKFVRAAELVREYFSVLDDPNNLIPVTEEELVVDAAIMHERADAEPEDDESDNDDIGVIAEEANDEE